MSYSRYSSQDLVYNSYSETYELASTLYTITIIPDPNTASVHLEGGTISGNSATGTYHTEVSYVVSKEGYTTKSGSVLLDHDDNIVVKLSSESQDLLRKGGGGGLPTYIKISGDSTTLLYAWYDNSNIFYTTSRRPSPYEPLLYYDSATNEGRQVANYQIIGKKADKIIIKNLLNDTSSDFSYYPSSNLKEVKVSNNVFYQNGGGGGGAKGEDWVHGKYNRRSKGGAGGGFYLLDAAHLTTESINGRDAGTQSDSLDPEMFPNIHSGRGGASGIDNGATIIEQKTAYHVGGGASGGSSAINPDDDRNDSFFGSGGGGAGGCEDAGGGKAGDGNPDYIANTTGENASNYHTIPTSPAKRKIIYKGQTIDISNLGKGGNIASGVSPNVLGTSGWIYIYKFEKEYQVFDMGRIGADPEAVTPPIIDGTDHVSNSQTITLRYDGTEHVSNDQPISMIIEGDQTLYEEFWKDCGDIDDTHIAETIRLGGI